MAWIFINQQADKQPVETQNSYDALEDHDDEDALVNKISQVSAVTLEHSKPANKSTTPKKTNR